jgi:hypothetical protein
MKKLLFLKLLALVACLSSALSASADYADFSATYNGKTIYYKITSSANKTVEVTDDRNPNLSVYSPYTGAVTIPSTVTYNGTTYTVTGIGAGAFSESNGLTSVSMPNTITYIGQAAFAFNATSTCSPNFNTVTIPNSVETIADYAFYNTKITTAYIGFRVDEIGDYAFKHEDNVPNVYCYAYRPPTIQANTFPTQGGGQYGGTIVGTLHLLAASYNTNRYQEANYWQRFRNITTYSGSTDYDVQIGGLYYLLGPVLSTRYIALVTNNGNYNCYSSSSYSVPATVTWMGEPFDVTAINDNAFRGSTSVNTLNLSNATNLTTIGSYACYGCTGLTTVYLSPSITTIEDYAFYNSGLSKLYTNNSTPQTIYSNTFSTRYNYCYVYVPYPKDIATYQAATYWSNFRMILSEQNYDFVSGGIYYRITGSNTVEVTCEDPDNHCSYTGNVSVPATVTWNGTTYNVTAIGEWAFSEARQVNLTAGTSPRGYTPGSLKSVSLPSSVTIIKPYAFSWCTGLTQVSIGSGVTTIDDYAFYYSTALTTITIPNSVTTLGQSAFEGCSALKNVTLGSGLNSIGNYAFGGCTVLEFVNCLKTTAPTMTSTAFTTNHYNTAHLIIPNGAQSAYVSTTWGNFINKKTIDAALAESVKLSDDVTLTTSGAYPWVIYRNYWESGGSYICATSSNSGQHSTSSVMTGTATVPANSTGTLTFKFKAWGEGTSSLFDKCIFAVDGVTKFTYGARDYDWESYTVELPAGTHTLTWTYQKDGSVNPTGDYFAVDNVKLVTQAIVVTGDVNGDGNTTIADVSALIDVLLGSSAPTAGADVNGDGQVSIADVSALIDLLLN